MLSKHKYMMKNIVLLLILFATQVNSQTKKSIDSINQIPYLNFLKKSYTTSICFYKKCNKCSQNQL